MAENSITSTLEAKIEEFISIYEHVCAENKALKEALSECREKLDNKTRREGELLLKIEELKKKSDNLQLIEAFRMSDKGQQEKQQAKRRIDKLSKEIDECIALLNI